MSYMKHQFVLQASPPQNVSVKQLLKKVIRGQRKNYAKRLRLIIKTEREYQYVAIDLALQNVQRFSLEEVVAFKAYVPQKRGGTVWMLGEIFGSGGVASD